MRRWKVFVAIGSVFALAAAVLWVVRLVRYSDIVLARWASIAAIIALLPAMLSLLLGIIGLFMQLSDNAV